MLFTDDYFIKACEEKGLSFLGISNISRDSLDWMNTYFTNNNISCSIVSPNKTVFKDIEDSQYKEDVVKSKVSAYDLVKIEDEKKPILSLENMELTV